MGMPIISRSVHLHKKQSLTIIIVNAAAFVGPIIPHLEGLNNFSVGQLQNSSHLIGAAECGWRSLDQVSWCQACKNRSTIQCLVRSLQYWCCMYIDTGKNETIYYIHWLQHCVFIQIVGQCLVTVKYGLSEVVPVDNVDPHFLLIYIAWQS